MRRTAPEVTRRAVLLAPAALAVWSLAACTRDTGPAPPPDPDDLLRAEAVERERSLLREYDAVLLVLPALAPRLVALRSEHAEHLLALTEAPPASPAASGSPAPAVPPTKTAAAALAGLVTAERAAAAAHGQAALAASRELAALLASLSASELSHPVVLA